MSLLSMVPDLSSGVLVKMEFYAFTDDLLTGFDSEEDTYSVMINPNTITRTLAAIRSDEQPLGATDWDGAWIKNMPEQISFEFVIDGNGIVHDGIADSFMGYEDNEKLVQKHIEKFLKVVYDYQSDKHTPNKVKIIYGPLAFNCVLMSLNITYQLFSANGYPLRAKINCSFRGVLDTYLSQIIQGKNSPDMTHKRVVKESDSLVAMANTIYESNDYYIDVAFKNQLDNFRKLNPGTEIYFPPLKPT